MKNLFCDSRDLSNEASVEALFVERLLKALGYPDKYVSRKQTLQEIVIGRGRSKAKYRPDYVLRDSAGNPKVVLDAKPPQQDPEAFHYQVSSYALYLNQSFPESNPVLYAALTNGFSFIVYPWDSNRPDLFLRFEDFESNGDQFLQLRSTLSFSAFNQVAATRDVFDFQRPGLSEIKTIFNECHDLIWKTENLGPTDAFYEFSKLMFIKIRHDNKIHDIISSGRRPVIDDFVFSTRWIEEQSPVEPNPVSEILFRQIQVDLERQIKKGSKKRIFDAGEGLNLKASTTYEVVRRLEHYDLYGIDEDLNGRMFETFLNATVRGKELGQFFTPRGVVHYMVDCAPLWVKAKASRPNAYSAPLVMDGCCGSGGFLIDAMARLTRLIGNITRLTNKQQVDCVRQVQNEHLYGIEFNPRISRIARLNMYLHGDGGSKIFRANTLDKELAIEAGLPDEDQDWLRELHSYLVEDGLRFDVVLTNPPFSMPYKSKDKAQNRVLEQYRIATTSTGKRSSSEKSNVLFLERYFDLLKPNTGELLTIIDDTVLNGENSQPYRDFLLANFVFIQVVSLPFNCFFRADANIKTSMLHLRKKAPGEKQGSIFMAITNNIGHDDHSRDTPHRNNLPDIAKFYSSWREGKPLADQTIYNHHPDEPLGCPMQVFEVHPQDLSPDRLDAFYYAPELRRVREGLRALEKKGEITLRKGGDFALIDALSAADAAALRGKVCKYFEIGDVTRDGTIVQHREDYFEKLPTRARLQVRAGDIIFAKNNSSRGTTVLIPKWFDGGLVTTGFIGIRPKDHEEGLLLWGALASDCFKKQVYYLAITASQPEVRESIFQNEMVVPWPATKHNKKSLMDKVKAVQRAKEKLNNALRNAESTATQVFES